MVVAMLCVTAGAERKRHVTLSVIFTWRLRCRSMCDTQRGGLEEQ